MSKAILTDIKGRNRQEYNRRLLTSLKSMDRSSRQEMNKATEIPSDTIVQLRLN